MPDSSERREHPRLHLSYPIRIGDAEPEGRRPQEHTVTQNLSARGAYLCTFREPPWESGAIVSVVVSVPHRLASSDHEVTLDLRGRARVVRIETPAPGTAGENGVPLSGVALEFEAPLSFQYAWV
jgi:hypothetical protein